MPRPRSSLICLDTTPYYHCVSRCVRRAFLCGTDEYTGQCYEHRRGWIEERLITLSQCFAIDLCAYAVMSNHTHVVLHVNQEKAASWSTREVVERWHALYSGTPLSQRFLAGSPLSEVEQKQLKSLALLWQERLCSISWYMRCLNEPIARMANAEDGCTGRFWEGRFKCQALLDEAALAACMAYVDLNPVRAGMSETPERADYTSIRRRVEALQDTAAPVTPNLSKQPKELLPFSDNTLEESQHSLPFCFKDYLQLVDWSGRCLREDKHGAIPSHVPEILQRLNLKPKAWLKASQSFENRFSVWVGSEDKVHAVCRSIGQRWVHGINACRRIF